MQGAAEEGTAEAPVEDAGLLRPERRLSGLLGSRLVLSLVSLGLVTAIDRSGRGLSDDALRGLYWTVLVGFVATALTGAMMRRGRLGERFAAAQIAIDVAIVSGLVFFSGGSDSVFTFLYALVTLYGAMLVERRGALVSAGLSSLAYGAVLWMLSRDLGGFGLAIGEARSPMVLGAVWGFHMAALFGLALLATALTSELLRTGAALDRSASDLRSLRDLHERITASITSGLLTTDSKGRIMTFNPEAERITGSRYSEAIGLDLEDVIPEARSRIEPGIGPQHVGSPTPRRRLEYVNRRGETLHLGLAASILRDAYGDDVGRVVIFQDVTDVVAMESELRQKERLAAVGEMAAKIAHEIRNPLASISGSVEILRSTAGTGEGDEGEPGRLMDIVVREVDRLNRLISDFLRYSRPAPLAPEAVPLADLVEEIVKMFEATKPASVELCVDVPADAVVWADPAQLKAVVWNLCLNAVEAMPDGGRLTLSAERFRGHPAQDPGAIRRNAQGGERDSAAADVRGRVSLSVVDTGCGIPTDVLDHIFEPFYTTKRSGSGLGLSTVHRIVENHGGELQVTSSESCGTTFRVVLPGAGASR